MGMVGGLTQLTPEELNRVRRDPKFLPRLESEISDADASRYCYLDKAWHGVHFLLVGDAGEEGRRTLSLYLVVSAALFIATAMLGRVLVVSGDPSAASGLLLRILRAIGILSFMFFILFGLLRLKTSGVRWLRKAFSRQRVTDSVFVPPDAVRKVMLGGASLGPIDDISAYYATTEEVRTLAPFLTALTDEEIRRRFDPARMRAFGIYVFGDTAMHADPSLFDYALDHLRLTIAFYQDAAKRGNAVVFSAG